MTVQELKAFLDNLILENYEALNYEVTYYNDRTLEGSEYANFIIELPDEQEVYIY